MKLEQDGIVDGLISEDGDLVALGAKVILTKLEQKNGVCFARVFLREELFGPVNPYQSKLYNHPSLLVDAALLLGNDYFPRLSKLDQPLFSLVHLISVANNR